MCRKMSLNKIAFKIYFWAANPTPTSKPTNKQYVIFQNMIAAVTEQSKILSFHIK